MVSTYNSLKNLTFNFQFWILFLLILCFNLKPLTAQIDRQFWFAIPKETDRHSTITTSNNVSFKIAAMDLDAKVTISMPNNSSFGARTFTVPAGKSHIEVLAENYAEFESLYANPALVDDDPVEGMTNRGILIESDNDITVYYDYDNVNNRQLFSLKGQNALGTDFYTPFQNIWQNDGRTQNGKVWNAYATIDIVATDDNTVVWIEPSVILKGHTNTAPFKIVLPKKGDTYSLVAADRTPGAHPAGTHIYVSQTEGSGAPIAVTVNDDSVNVHGKGCADIIGDQIVPTSILGKKYLVMCGYEATSHNSLAVQDIERGEQIFVITTQPNTKITFQDTSGFVLRTSNIAAAGGVDYISPNPIYVPAQNAIFINADKPIYVLHITGIDCEMGGAVLPPITDCTGSPEVTFYRSGTVNKLTLNLMIPYDQTKPFDAADQSYKFFRIYYDNGTSVPIDPTWFEPIKSAGWAALKYERRDISTALVPVDQAVKVVNEKDFFHLGITNGTTGQTNKYGYFSSYNSASPSAVVASINEPAIRACFGDTVILKAKGGLKNGYTWHYGTPTGPPTYLSDYKSATPRVFCPPGTHNFHVTIHLAKCFGDVTLPVTVIVKPEVKAAFDADKTTGCAPMNFKITNHSTGGNIYEWTIKKDNNADIPFTPPSNNSFTLPNSGFFQNNTSPYAPIHYTIKLKSSIDFMCKDSVKKELVIYPQIQANFLPIDSVGCHPVLTPFRNLSSGNVTDSSYYWDFGDGNSSVVKNPVHNYQNLFGKNDTTFNVMLVASSPFYCRDTARSTLTVHPFIKAGFAVDTVKGCSPLTVKIYNTSLNRKAISQYIWDFGDGTIRITDKDTLMHTYPVNISATPANYKLLLTVRHPFSSGCPDTISRKITVYPQSTLSYVTVPGGNSFCDSTKIDFKTTASAAITSYLWDFGDGNTSTLKDPSHLFTNLTTIDKTYKVKVTGMSNEYCNGYAERDIVVHPFLDPQFSVDVPSACAPFNAAIKNKSRGGIASYEWKYGDGSSDTHSVIDTIHRYRNTTSVVFAPQLKLVVKNSAGCRDSVMQRITVYPEIKADFSPNIIIGCNPLPITFTNKSTYLNNVSKYFKWEFGDNTSSTLQSPEHVFTNTTNTTQVYPVKLTVTSEYNCMDDTIINVNVYPYVEAKFSVDSVKGCSPYDVKIHNSSRGSITQYQWNYEDGNVDNHSSAEFSHIYINNATNNPSNQPLKRYIKLIASNTNGICRSRDSIQITIYPEVKATFVTNVTEGCNPLNVRYTNQSGPGMVPVAYQWFFGDGGTAVSKNPSHTFENITSSERTFTTKLKAFSIYNCVDSSTISIKVYPFIKAGFSFDKPVGCSPHPISITNSSSAGSNGFQWIFGDGQQSNITAPVFSHTYRNLGTSPQNFYPKLVASYNGKCQDTATLSLQVFPEVTAAFTQDTLRGCHPLEISFSNQSRNANRYNWSFGDKGTSIVTSPKHTYTNFSNVDSVYNLTLTASSIFNCSNTIAKKVIIYAKPKALLDVENSVNCPPFTLPIKNLSEAADYYYWSFGDGDSIVSTDQAQITHIYDNLTANTVTYNLKLFVQSVHNCTDQIQQSINIYPRVIASFTPDTAGCSPLLVPMVNKTLRAVTYKWDFGDNITSALKNPTNRFFNNSTEDTTFNVRMIGFSQFGCSDTMVRQVTVYPQPTVDFSALPSHLFYPDARVNIDNQTNPGNWNYLWNFDDGQTSTALEPGVHEYLRWGNYNIKLNVWSNHCSDSASHRIRVFAPKTIADFDASDNGCVPLTVAFTNHSTWATSYKWEFDDGSVSTEMNPNHIYYKPGKYQVKLTTYGDGPEDVTYREVVVYPKPEVSFDVSPREVMLPDALVQCYNTSKLGNKYLWEFGDGETSESFEPTHTYKELGKYDITLNVWTEYQCFDSVVIKEAVEVKGTGVLIFPNAFKPSTDGPGDGKYTLPDIGYTVFHPHHDGVAEYKLEIYDRLGELIFESKDVNKGWDGYYKGKLCKSDVYIWKAKGKFYNGSSFNKAGDVTLLR